MFTNIDQSNLSFFYQSALTLNNAIRSGKFVDFKKFIRYSIADLIKENGSYKANCS